SQGGRPDTPPSVPPSQGGRPELRWGWTTGTCAAAACKAAALTLLGGEPGPGIEVGLPDGTRTVIPLLWAAAGKAAVRKDAGDDPDVTHGATVEVVVAWADSGDVEFRAGVGIGTVTRPGLSVPPGEPAINPVPRRMIRQALREVTERPAIVVISIPDGEQLAARTANPRLGVVGGLSILGTSGRVRPYSCSAYKESLECLLRVARASGVTSPVLVPGNIGRKAACQNFPLRDDQIVEVGNEWGALLELLGGYPFERLLALGHPGKLAKLAAGCWDTHSSRSRSAVPIVSRLGRRLLGPDVPASSTVEGFFQALGEQRSPVADRLALHIRRAISRRVADTLEVAAVLVDLGGNILGSSGDLSPWR
ncbi:MAG: cobalamin biosynthesis protein CbiD, partial [Armatimonadetes bacterium]|nr:cobalamin biosynthesis protein CbiD [Armatimonadota bacterium]